MHFTRRVGEEPGVQCGDIASIHQIDAVDRKDFRAAATPSWWESILEPVIVTATAAVIVVLLFTVRES